MNFNPPNSLDMDGWNSFENEFRKKAPVRYLIKYGIVLKISYLFASLSHLAWAIRYRTVRKYHLVDTKLNPGYHEIDTRILHANFELLVDYVEIECANMVGVADRAELTAPRGWRGDWFPRVMKLKEKRSRELGMQHLMWETTLASSKLDEMSRSPDQAARAVQVMILYIWWKDTFPNRKALESPDRGNTGLEFLSRKWQKDNPEMNEKIHKWSVDSHIQELEWDKEEEEMLIALMKIRKGLWT
jgi:hypothetical protein